MKLFIKKINALLLKHYQYGIALLLISGFSAYLWTPTTFFPQKTGIVESVEETTEWVSAGGGRTYRSFQSEILIFTIDGEKYKKIKTKENFDRLLLLSLSGNEITYRFSTIENEKYIVEIIYEGEVIIGSKGKRVIFNKFVIDKFNFWFTLFLLSLSWCVWALVLKWRGTADIKLLTQETKKLNTKN